MTIRDTDLTGELLKAQRLQMLQDIAEELSPDVVFPTCFDLSMRIRVSLRDPHAAPDRLHALLMLEPLISAKLVQLANTPPHKKEGIEIRDFPTALKCLGSDIVRATALAITTKQIQRAQDMAGFGDIAYNLWQHSRISASACRIIAQNMTRIPPDEAMFVGLVHDLGAFYMLYRAAQYSELRTRPDTVKYLIMQWHESIGVSLLSALGLPETVADAACDHDVLRACPAKPRNLRDVVYVGNMLAGSAFEWKHQDIAQETIDRHAPDPVYLALQEEIQTHAANQVSVMENLATPMRPAVQLDY